MKIELLKIEDLIPYHNNPRVNDPAVDYVASSIAEFGFKVPIVVDKNNIIIAGHTRLKAAIKLGLKEVPCIRATDLTDAQIKAFRIADNKTNEFAEWDFAKLDIELEELEDFDYDFGFDESDFPAKFNEGLTDDDYIPEVEEPICKTGDLWKLGEHRLLCGDATKKEDVERLMDGKKADMVFTDPPYGMDLDTDYSALNSKPEFVEAKHLKSMQGNKYSKVIGDDKDYDPSHLFAMFPGVKEMFLWGGDYYSDRIPDKNNGSWIVWDKRNENEQLDKMFGSCFELCWSKTKHKREIARIQWAGVFGTEQEFDHKRHHPTQKPIKLSSWFIKKYSKEGWNIIYLFGGSGSTLIACEQTDRTCYMMELDPKYCDVIIKRWEEYTGLKAEKI